MHIVGEFVEIKSGVKNKLLKWVDVENKEQRSKSWVLGNSVKSFECRGNVVYNEGRQSDSNVGA